ncbi:hypothetical protein O3P69_017757, partial [Scylla paramamosain]
MGLGHMEVVLTILLWAPTVFQTNVDSPQTRHNYVEPPVLGRFVRLHVLEWHSQPSMRFELLGCQ